MDLSGFVRRFQSSPESGPENNAEHQHHVDNNKPQGLTVDTSVMKDFKSKLNSLENAKQQMEPQWGNNEGSPPGSGRSSMTTTPTSTRSIDSGYHMRRRRSNSECLMLARNGGGQDLPGPCKEYIAGVKQILARSEENQPALLRRRSSMSLKSSSMLGK